MINGIKTRVTREITPEWDRLMRLGEILGKGQMTVIFNEGKPVQINVAIKKIALDREDDMEKFRVISLSK